MCLQGREKVSIKVLAADVCDFILESVSLTFLLACDTNWRAFLPGKGDKTCEMTVQTLPQTLTLNKRKCRILSAPVLRAFLAFVRPFAPGLSA